MKKKSRILAGLLCLCMIGSLCACGKPKPADSVGEGESTSVSETTVSGTTSEETESETTSTTSEGIKVGKEILSSQGSSETDTASEEDSSEGEEESAPSVTNCGYDKISEEQAVELFFKALYAMNEQDWETVLDTTNIFDVTRFDINSKGVTEEEILEQLKSGANQYAVSDWKNQEEVIKSIEETNPTATKLTSEELDALNDAIKRFNSLSARIDNPPQYRDGYVINIENGSLDGQKFFYVLEDEHNHWRFDICFGIMFAMEDYFKEAIENPEGVLGTSETH